MCGLLTRSHSRSAFTPINDKSRFCPGSGSAGWTRSSRGPSASLGHGTTRCSVLPSCWVWLRGFTGGCRAHDLLSLRLSPWELCFLHGPLVKSKLPVWNDKPRSWNNETGSFRFLNALWFCFFVYTLVVHNKILFYAILNKKADRPTIVVVSYIYFDVGTCRLFHLILSNFW